MMQGLVGSFSSVGGTKTLPHLSSQGGGVNLQGVTAGATEMLTGWTHEKWLWPCGGASHADPCRLGDHRRTHEDGGRHDALGHLVFSLRARSRAREVKLEFVTLSAPVRPVRHFLQHKPKSPRASAFSHVNSQNAPYRGLGPQSGSAHPGAAAARGRGASTARLACGRSRPIASRCLMQVLRARLLFAGVAGRDMGRCQELWGWDLP